MSQEADQDIDKLQAEIAKIEQQLVEEKLPQDKKDKKKRIKKAQDKQLMDDQTCNEEAESLLKMMLMCVTEDNQNNRDGKPALSKFTSLDQVCRELRKLHIQDKFIENGGLTVLAKWLEPLPDQTYPNQAVVKEILQTL